MKDVCATKNFYALLKLTKIFAPLFYMLFQKQIFEHQMFGLNCGSLFFLNYKLYASIARNRTKDLMIYLYFRSAAWSSG